MSDPRHLASSGSSGPLLGGALTNSRLLTGSLVGAAVTLVLTNEAVQRAAINAAAHLWLAAKGGLEETKERFRDAESEIKASRTR
jgi:hypothetical protein